MRAYAVHWMLFGKLLTAVLHIVFLRLVRTRKPQLPPYILVGAESRDRAAVGARTKNRVGNSIDVHTFRWYRLTVTVMASEDDGGDREDSRSIGLTVWETQTETIRIQVPHVPGAPDRQKMCVQAADQRYQ